MIRYYFGAFEPLDTAQSILVAPGLIRLRKTGAPGQVREHAYLLVDKGRAAMDAPAQSAPELAWYRDRARIVARVAGGRGGTALKDQQYLQQECKETDLARPIRSIADRVRLRLEGRAPARAP